jgi:predicted nuclease of predicted toxin-antitoxin system
MRLLFDQNLSFKLCVLLSDLFPDSAQIRALDLDQADDRAVWQFAKDNGFAVVSQDADFAELATLYGAPPKVIWLRCGNRPTGFVEKLIRDHAQAIGTFEQDSTAACLQVF